MTGLKSMRALFFTLLFLFPVMAHSEVKTEVYCFRSQEGKSINFELRTYYDSTAKWQGASVKYSKSKEAITLVYGGAEEESPNPNRPPEITTKWVEVSGGMVTGDYVMASQDPFIYGIVYTNRKSGKKYIFEHDSNMSLLPETGCQW
jgi:hypothetical protein